jgi:peptidoglycan/LPS O-acetylase OafA/YrhL
MPNIRAMAMTTPAERVRHIDLLRAVAITAVVTGHWLVIAIEYDPAGRLTGFSALGVLTWSHPVTWLFQVMPVFFMVGGYANAASLAAHRRRGGDPAGWLLDRSTRLVRPTTVLLLVIAASAAAARLAGVDPAQIATAAWLASLPLWFLVAYLAMIALTPLMYALHRRAGPLVPPLLLLPVLAGDLLRLHYGDESWAYGNFLFGWLAIHQLGFCWRDGQLPARPRGSVPLLLAGLGGLVLLTYAGPYPISMVTVPGQQLQNASPPSMALVALATAQLGLALLLQRPSERWLRRRWPWTAVVGANAVVLTVFLWHMAAAVLATVALHMAGVLPTPAVDSVAWLLWQLPWLALLAVTLAGLVAVFGGIEARAGAPVRVRWLPPGVAGALSRGTASPLLVATAAGYAGVLGGLLWVAVAGDRDHGPFALPTGALLTYLAGAAALWLARHR